MNWDKDLKIILAKANMALRPYDTQGILMPS